MNITSAEAKKRLRGYIKKYYCEVRPDVFDWNSFQKELYGYVVSLSHNIAKTRGWQGHNWRQGLRRHLYSYALDEIDKVNNRKIRKEKYSKIIRKIFSLGIAR